MDTSRLLELLEDDARASDEELATMLGASVKEIAKARRDLQKKKVIAGYRTVVDWRRITGERATAVIQVKVVPAQKTGFDRVCAQIAKDKRVSDVFITSGKYDLMVTVRASCMDEISEFVTEKLAPMKEVMGTYTHVILKEFKREGATFEKSGNKRLPIS